MGEINDKQVSRYQGLPCIDTNCVLGTPIADVDVSYIYSFGPLPNSFNNPGQQVA